MLRLMLSHVVDDVGRQTALVGEIPQADQAADLPVPALVPDLKGLHAELAGAAVHQARVEHVGLEIFRLSCQLCLQQFREILCIRRGHEVCEAHALQGTTWAMPQEHIGQLLGVLRQAQVRIHFNHCIANVPQKRGGPLQLRTHLVVADLQDCHAPQQAFKANLHGKGDPEHECLHHQRILVHCAAMGLRPGQESNTGLRPQYKAAACNDPARRPA
mmetsp:Transcript_111787/g.266667  ORF Transcript_111787/g.266667 Transcript_111787/m.266667 type:complete len:216 (+) Transcript_111787:558-1205(+)